MLHRCLLVLACAAPATLHADPAPVPAECGASIQLKTKVTGKVAFAGRVTALKALKSPARLGSGRYEVTVATGAKTHQFTLAVVPDKVPFAVKDTIDVVIAEAGGFHPVYDGVIKNAKGEPLVVVVASGAIPDPLGPGWTVKTGAITEQRQDPNQQQKSIRRIHAVDITHGKTTTTIPPDRCAELVDGGTRFLVSASAITWEGVRPPEGIDYQSYAMIRR